MSFNTSNIQSDTFSGVYSISAPIHYVDGIPISKNNDNLKLGDNDNSVVECLELLANTSITAPISILDVVSTGDLLPILGIGNDILVEGNFDMSGNQIKNLNILTLSGGSTGLENQVLSVDGSGNLKWKNDSQADVSQWASYPALQNVDLSNNSIVNGVNGTFTGYLQAPTMKTTTIANYNGRQAITISNDLTSTSDISCANVSANGIVSETAQLGLYSGNHPFLLSTGSNDITTQTTANIVGFGTISSDATETKNIKVFNSDKTQNYEMIYGTSICENNLPSLTFSNTENADYAYITGQNIEATQSVVSQLVQVFEDATLQTSVINLNNDGTVECGQLLPRYKLETDFYVSPNGLATGVQNGSIENPYPTIQEAIDYCESLTTSDNVYRYIHIMGGNYDEDLVISKKIFLVGEAESPYSASVGCCINGNVSINVDVNGTDMFNNFVNIQGLLINGKIDFTSTNNSGLNIENSYIYTPNDTSGRGIYFNPSSTNSRIRMWNSQIISGGNTGTDPLLEITNVGSLIMNNCYLSAKGLQNCLKFSGTATCDTVVNTKFECSNSSASVLPLVSITATASATYSFGVCAFFYSSSTSKSGNSNACGILNNNASGNNNILVSYCSFFLLGTSSSLNYAVQDANYGTATQMIVLYYMNGASLTNAFSIHATLNVNKFQLQIVS